MRSATISADGLTLRVAGYVSQLQRPILFVSNASRLHLSDDILYCLRLLTQRFIPIQKVLRAERVCGLAGSIRPAEIGFVKGFAGQTVPASANPTLDNCLRCLELTIARLRPVIRQIEFLDSRNCLWTVSKLPATSPGNVRN